MLTIAIDSGEVTIAGNARVAIFSKGDVFPLPVTFTRGGEVIAAPADLVLNTALCTEGERGGNGTLATASTFTRSEAGVGAVIVPLPLNGVGVTGAFEGGGTEHAAELQFKMTFEGYTRHSDFVPVRLLNSLFA